MGSLGSPGRALGPFGGPWGGAWEVLGVSAGRPGAIWCRSGQPSDGFGGGPGGSWKDLGASLVLLGGPCGPTWRLQGRPWWLLGRHLGVLGGYLVIRKSLKNHRFLYYFRDLEVFGSHQMVLVGLGRVLGGTLGGALEAYDGSGSQGWSL